MSIVRIGMGETKKYAAGFDAIFGKKKASTEKATAKASGAKKKKPAKKAAKKK